MDSSKNGRWIIPFKKIQQDKAKINVRGQLLRCPYKHYSFMQQYLGRTTDLL